MRGQQEKGAEMIRRFFDAVLFVILPSWLNPTERAARHEARARATTRGHFSLAKLEAENRSTLRRGAPLSPERLP